MDGEDTRPARTGFCGSGCWGIRLVRDLVIGCPIFDAALSRLRWAIVRSAIRISPVESIGIFATAKIAHLSDDETVAKMGHPLVGLRVKVG